MPVPGPSRRPRARPVAEVPVAGLVADCDELARDWLLELVSAAPLAEVPRLRLDALAAEAPALCAAAIRALADDAALEGLRDSTSVSRAGRLAGARDGAAGAEAVELLRGVLWRAVLASMSRPAPELVAALADRLAAVAAAITTAVLATEGGGPEPRGSRLAPPRMEGEASPLEALFGLGEPRARDETSSLTEPSSAAPEPAAPVEVVARDERGRVLAEDPETHIEARLAAAGERAMAVLAVDLDGVDRLMAAQSGREVAELIETTERAVHELLRPGDTACRAGLGQLWLTLPGTGPAGARALALRLSAAIERSAEHRGRPLTASIGVATSPGDGTTAGELMEHAEDGLWAARAAGSRGAPPPAV